MKTKLYSLALSLLLMSASAFAQLPTGNYTGFISNNPFNEWCRLNRADVEFQSTGNNQYQVSWRESGYAQSGGFCDNAFDAIFTPTGRDNEWNVNFYNDWDLAFGRAVLNGNRLEITASYTGGRTAYIRFNTRFDFSDDRSSTNYSRRIDTWSGPSLFANGNLYH